MEVVGQKAVSKDFNAAKSGQLAHPVEQSFLFGIAQHEAPFDDP